MANPLTVGDAGDLVDKAIGKIWVKGTEMEGNDYKKYYHVETGVVDLTTSDSSISGLGYATRTIENAQIVGQGPVQGYDKDFTQVFYDTLLTVTRKMWEFGIKKRKLEGLVEEARMACSNERERLCAERLDNSQATSYTHTDLGGSYTISTAGGNTDKFICTDQAREDSGTDNNNQVTDGTTVNMDFDYDALKAAHRTASLVLNPKGLPMNIDLDTLVCKKSSSVHFKALEILAAIRRGKIPESADNDGAGVPAFKVIDLPWLANDAYWWMLDSKMKRSKYGLQYLEHSSIHLDQMNIVYKTEFLVILAEMLVKTFRKFREYLKSFQPLETILSQAL